MILLIFSGCAQTESLAGNHQAARLDFQRQGKELEKKAFRDSARSEHIKAALLYSDAATLLLKAAQESSLLGNTVRVERETRLAAHDFVKASDESLKAGDFGSSQ
ncbi:hypothetical protein ACSYAY_01140 [Leptospirillum ferriphilum]|nr:hypothetical protein [Leptospirillum ferriphilum]